VRVFISGSEAVEVDVEVAVAAEDCAALDDGEDGCCVEVKGAAEDCAVEEGVAEDCVVEVGAGGAGAAEDCASEICDEQASTPHNAIAQPSNAITRVIVPPGKRIAARIFIRLSTAPPRCGTRVFRSNYASVNVPEVYSPVGTASIDPAAGLRGGV
jgi:hypothetical protein